MKKELIDCVNVKGKKDEDRYRQIRHIDIDGDCLSVEGELYFVDDSEKVGIKYFYEYSFILPQSMESKLISSRRKLSNELLNFKCIDSKSRVYNLNQFFQLDMNHYTEMFYMGTENEINNIIYCHLNK